MCGGNDYFYRLLQAGDVCILMMENSIEFVLTWLGLSKAGVVVAFINTNLVGPALAHAVSVTDSTTAIVSTRYADAWSKAEPLVHQRGMEYLHFTNKNTERNNCYLGAFGCPSSSMQAKLCHDRQVTIDRTAQPTDWFCMGDRVRWCGLVVVGVVWWCGWRCGVVVQ